MGLYDQVQQAQSPYMSQFVGSVVPELNQYAGVMNQRYNEAQDQDDMLSEALGNLHHLNFDADTQYANELKSQYYQRLQDRSARGDFENMGRRTRMDAMRFSQAYQPLIQRQQDMSELVKKINADQTIADPAVKQQLIQKAMWQNTPQRDPVSGDYNRDQNGRVQLQGIQDMQYAPDVDINKAINEELSKKEADVRSGKFYTDGHGNLVNTVEKVRTPQAMADMAQQVMSTDPKIKAMLARDADLKTYNMAPDQVHQELANRGLDKSVAQQLKSKGLNNSEIATHLKALPYDGTVSPLDAYKAKLMQQGYSEPAAEKVILNNRLQQEQAAPYANLAGDAYSMYQQTTDHMTDHFAILKKQAAMANMKDPNVMTMQGTNSTTSQEDPAVTAKLHTAAVEDLQSTAQNTQAAILAGLKATGTATGNSKQDIATAIALMHNPVKLNALKLQLAQKDPMAAQTLEAVADQYNNKAALVQNQSNHLDDIEKAGGVDWDKLYQSYKTAKSGQVWNKAPLSKEDFINKVRKNDVSLIGDFGDFATSNKISDYNGMLQKGMKAINDGTAQAAGYTTIEPTGEGKSKDLTEALTSMVLRGGVSGIDLNNPNGGQEDVLQSMGIKPGKDAATRMAEKGLSVRFNTEGVNGKPTITVSALDGTKKVFQAQNLPQGIQDELNSQVHEAGAMARTTNYGRTQVKQALIGFGSSTSSDITPQYLKTVNPGPSGVIKSINDRYAVKVKDAGDGNRRYELYSKNPDGTTTSTGVKFDSVDDLYAAMGKEREQQVTPTVTQKQLNTQR